MGYLSTKKRSSAKEKRSYQYDDQHRLGYNTMGLMAECVSFHRSTQSIDSREFKGDSKIKQDRFESQEWKGRSDVHEWRLRSGNGNYEIGLKNNAVSKGKSHWHVKNKKLSTERNIFFELATKWKQETSHFSTLYHITSNSNYLKIIGMGDAAIPLMLEDLKDSIEHWHVALHAITRENPVNREDMSDLERVREAWISWGRQKNIIR